MTSIKLGLNIDHVATLRNARGGYYPDPYKAAKLAEECGVDNITLHLREDRRHIRDDDLTKIKNGISIPMNLEMAPTEEMLKITKTIAPEWLCLVPERREEVTTEGGLKVSKNLEKYSKIIRKLQKRGIKVSLFIDPVEKEIIASSKLKANAIELHTGEYCVKQNEDEYQKLVNSAKLAKKLMLEVHAGHGLNFNTAKKVAMIQEVIELNIGHFLISESIFLGLKEALKKMKKTINSVRS